ncbi:MAG: SCO family protein [Nitrospinae bacterium]|nr:SCO family protein [Nitrospinota bacterium]
MPEVLLSGDHEALGADAERVRFVFITVDSERDTSQRLQQHLVTFNADFVGLTGTQVKLESVYAAYGVFREKASRGAKGKGYLVNHNTSAFVIDPDGLWRLRHSSITPSEDILQVQEVFGLLGVNSFELFVSPLALQIRFG